MDLRVFNDIARRVETIAEKVEKMHRNQADLRLKRWLDHEEVCQTLGISKRTLQTYRENGMLPYCIIRHKIFFKPEDVQKLLNESHY